ncbi:MAG: VanZ family protein [Desulfobulbus sp.]|nr:VanZ family protein [Desulfobulbus sp.]
MFHFLLTPSEIPSGLGCILTLHDGEKQPPLVIAQWQEHLALFVRVPETEKGYREVGLQSQLKTGKTIALTIVTTATETNVFVDGPPMAHYAGFSLLAKHGQTKGRIILGNNQYGTEPWHGSIQRVTIYDHANASASESLPANRPIIDYRFSAYNNESVSNQDQTPCLLFIPARFTPLAPIFLAPISRKEFHRGSTWQDVVSNILGFIPISFCLAVLSGKVQSKPGKQFFLTVSLAFLFSLIIESVQVVLPSRHSSQLDLLCNTVGGVLVASIFWISNRNTPHSLANYRRLV